MVCSILSTFFLQSRTYSWASWSAVLPVGAPPRSGRTVTRLSPSIFETFGLMPQFLSSVGSRISHMRAMAWSTFGRTMLMTTFERLASSCLALRAAGPVFRVSTNTLSAVSSPW